GGNGHFPGGKLVPHILKHFLGNVAVEPADGVPETGAANRGNSHRETFGVIAGAAAPEADERIERDPRLVTVSVEVVVDEGRLEEIESGRNRCVRGEDVIVP